MKTQKTKINVNDTKKIEARLTIIEKGCRARLFDMARIESAIKKAETQLSRFGISKKYWIDCQIDFDTEKMPMAYRGMAEGTGISLRRFQTGWFVTHIARVPCGSSSGGACASGKLWLSEIARNAIPGRISL